MNIGYTDDEHLRPYIEPQTDINDQLRIEKMLQMGFTRREIQESLTENRYDDICATYLLLARDLKSRVRYII